jgi:ubiquinone/menaquinone biosynthesis C-methylase UbiE
VTADYDYSAREAYRDPAVGASYERDRFTSALGRYRLRREHRAVGELLEHVPMGVRMLDCPCGTGRWWPVLRTRADSLVALDVSEGMVEHATARARADGGKIEVRTGDAEALPLDDRAVDWSFCYALTKHLPRPVQYRVLAELGRVSDQGVICSFGVLGHMTYEIWRRRHRAWRARGLDESVPLLVEELEVMGGYAGLELVDTRRATTPIGTEHVCLFRRAQTS